MTKVAVIGCNHHNAPVEVRERLAFNPAQTELALDQWRLRFPKTEAVLLSTCNRVELYAASQEPDLCPTHQEMAEFLAECRGLKSTEIFDELFERQGEDAIRHLFMVACSLDSMVLGEAQIIAQVREAYKLSQRHHSSGTLTSFIFERALGVAKRVATETAIQQKRISIPSVAVADFAKEIFEHFDDKRVMVIGAGEMGEETLRYLYDEGARSITVVNRSFEKAEAIAQKWQAHAIEWSELETYLARMDIVVTTTGATEPIVTAEQFAAVHRKRSSGAMLILDLAIPRDFDPAIGQQFPEVYLYDIGDLRQVCERNRQARQKEMAAAIHIVEEETGKFMAQLNHRATAPIIKRLREGIQKPKEDELERLFKLLPELDERSKSEINKSFDRLINKLLHPPLESLKDESRSGVPYALLHALKTLFQLKD